MGCMRPACASRSGPASSTSNFPLTILPAATPPAGSRRHAPRAGWAAKYWLPRAALTEVLSYGEGARALAVGRAQRQGRYEQLARVQIVEQVHANGRLKLRTANGQLQMVPLDELTAPARLRLFRRVDGKLEPLAVLLNEDGLPRPAHAWEHTFQVANRRVERLGLAGFRCTPHMLRHILCA